VVVPTRDRAHLVEAALGSVLRQPDVALEVVVVDAGSVDETPEVLRRLARADDRVRVVQLDSPAGPSVARNRGLDAAAGDLVGFLDDDDEWMPYAAAAAARYLASRPGLGGVSGWHEVVVEGASPLHYRGPLVYGGAELLWCNFPASPFAVFWRDALGDELRFDEDLVTCEDWDLYLRCARRRPMETVPAVLYRYHQRPLPRVSRDVSRRVAGRARFLAKHGADMTPRCRSYHEARLEIMATEGLSARARLGLSLTRRVPPAVAAAIAAESASARVGRLRGDPARSARTLLRLVRRLG